MMSSVDDGTDGWSTTLRNKRHCTLCFWLFELSHDEQTQFCIFHTRLQQSEWRVTDDVTIPLQGLSLDNAWNNIVASIGHLDTTSEAPLEEQIINREQQEKLLQLIDSLEKRCRAEKQTRKKYELHQEILKLRIKIKQV